MLLGKRKEKLIRDIAAMVFTAVEHATVRLARPYREAMEREEVDRVAAIVVKAMKADRIEWREPVGPRIEGYNAYFGKTDEEQIEAGLVAQLLIDRTGPGDRQFRLIAYPPSENGPSLYVFTQGTESDCRDAWPTAVKWMEKRFPDPPSDEPVDPEPPRPESYKLFGTPETGHGRLIIEPDGGGNRFILSAYLPKGTGKPSSHLFRRGTRAECGAAWDDALEWMEKRFPENKA